MAGGAQSGSDAQNVDSRAMTPDGTKTQKQLQSSAAPAPAGGEDKPLALGEAPLSEEQKVVLEHIIAGKSVFITGCGGTGKSHLMKHAIKRTRISQHRQNSGTGGGSVGIPFHHCAD
ncbi:hypothetical protein T484DRAFT_1767373 [Baffinella frigidus]|nr:hypothetical protein T484DRAFT_1767373 [Cryptophyta sp. CCMP2293]